MAGRNPPSRLITIISIGITAPSTWPTTRRGGATLRGSKLTALVKPAGRPCAASRDTRISRRDLRSARPSRSRASVDSARAESQ